MTLTFQNSLIVIRSIINAIFALSVNVIFIFRNYEQYKKDKVQNWGRILLNIGIFFYFLNNLLKILFFQLNVAIFGLVSEDNHIFSINSLLYGFTIMFGLIFTFYINFWDYVLYSPIFFYIGSIFIYFSVGNYDFMYYFQFFGGLITVIALIEGGIRVKTHLALGIGFALFFQVIGLLFHPPINTILDIIGSIVGILYSILNSKKIMEDFNDVR